jgi:hypothetical protein
MIIIKSKLTSNINNAAPEPLPPVVHSFSERLLLHPSLIGHTHRHSSISPLLDPRRSVNAQSAIIEWEKGMLIK